MKAWNKKPTDVAVPAAIRPQKVAEIQHYPVGDGGPDHEDHDADDRQETSRSWARGGRRYGVHGGVERP